MPSGYTYPVLMGDLWSFKCPAGGYFGIFVDTMNDNANSTSNLDPMLEVVDSKGNFIDFGDDDFPCAYAPTCGYGCPAVGYTPCGSGTHTVAVGSVPGYCKGGGGYKVELWVIDKKGNLWTDSKTGLGGGAKIKAPKWASGLGKSEPVIDDSVLPSLVFEIPDPTLTTLEPEDAGEEVDDAEAATSLEEMTVDSEARKAKAIAAQAAKREAMDPHRP
jgi:hypothetical protein